MAEAKTDLMTARDLFALQFVGDPQLSPDGWQVAFVVTTSDLDANEYRSRIWLAPADGSAAPVPLTSGEKVDTSPRWSPDGTQIAFLSTRAGKPQLYLLALAGGEARKISDLRDGAGAPAWSPDGKRLAFAAPVGSAPDEEVKSQEERDQAERLEPLRIEQLRFKFDGRGFIHGKPAIEKRQHLFVIDVPEDARQPLAEAQQVTDGDWDDTEPAWSPDSRRLAFVSYRDADADRVFRSDIWVVTANGRGRPRRLTRSDGRASGPSWSPDGKTIAYVATLEREQPFATQRLWTVRANGEHRPQALTAGLDRDVQSGPMSDQTLPASSASPVWSADGATLLFTVGDRGNQGVWRVSAPGGEAEQVIGGTRVVTAFSAGPNAIVFGATDSLHPAEIFVTDLKGREERQLTNLNADFLASKKLSAPECLSFVGNGGDEIDGWLMRPVGMPKGETYPLILMIHGGPHAQYGNAFFHEFQFLAARGYGILYTNPHGSSGRGEAFARALAGRWGEYDLPDLMAGIDHLLARGEGDPERLGVGGGSYGGFMTNWVLGHSDRFKAAVSMRSIANLLNFWGTSDIFHTGNIREFGLPWEEFERYRALSPIMYAANFTTPTLILHQEEDHRCPIEQGEQLFVALKLRGIPARFVRFPQESHGLSRNGKPQHRLQRLEEIVAWYDRYLKPAKVQPKRKAKKK